ncbi:hypothetical protein MKX01_027026 [Papaver californicum]|nr:hypothetical protein MKX01_027026 [Papaver californicum]
MGVEDQTCEPSENIIGVEPPPGECKIDFDVDCCKSGESYLTFTCSPTDQRVVLTLNHFQEGGDGGRSSTCDSQFHSNSTPFVALSTGWFNNGERCLRIITVEGNIRSVVAKVVDECDSVMGCDEEHAYQPPCRNNIVDASPAVWEELGVPREN